jgi:hypothetical protein
MPRLVGSLVRIVLLIPLLAGARADCGMQDGGAAQARTAGAAAEPGCHSAEAQPSDRGDAPARPRSGGPLSEHCPAYHSCALDFSVTARLEQAEAGLPSLPTAMGSDAFATRSLLPEVPPPRS